MTTRHLQRTKTATLCMATILTLVSGCTPPVQPKPFEDFYEASVGLQGAGDANLLEVQDLTREGLSIASPLGENISFADAILEWSDPGNPMDATMEAQPLYIDVQENRRGLDQLNAAFAEYAELLARLAGGSAKDAERIEALAKDANSNLRAVRDQLKAGISDDDLALVATIGAEILRQKIEHDRRTYLKETMDFAQPRVETFANLGASTISLIAGDLKAPYSAWIDEQRSAYNRAGASERRRIVASVIAQNERIELLLASLKTIRASYEKIPTAHRDLRAQIDKPESFVAAVQRLRDDVQRLRKLRDELAKTEASSGEAK